MKNKSGFINYAVMIILMIIMNSTLSAQKGDDISKYLKNLPDVMEDLSMRKYKMTAVYTNRDLYGNFTGKLMVSGEYTRRFNGDTCKWNNVSISSSNSFSGDFPKGSSQSYMEDFKYIPSDKMLQSTVFKDFPTNPENVYARNLIWDMMGLEHFARDFNDTLKLNKIYRITGPGNEFDMAEIGTYSHTEIQLCRTGISVVNDVMCSIIEFRAIDNKIELNMDAVKTKGTEQYWGTVWVSLTDRLILHAEMYGGTIQEIEISGMENKFLVKTIRELWVDKIQ